MPEAKEATYICKLQEAKPEKNDAPFFLIYHSKQSSSASVRRRSWLMGTTSYPDIKAAVRVGRRLIDEGFTHIHVFRLPDLPCEGCEINADAALEGSHD